MLKKIIGKGGFVVYFDINDVRIVENVVLKGDRKVKLIYDVMGY